MTAVEGIASIRSIVRQELGEALSDDAGSDWVKFKRSRSGYFEAFLFHVAKAEGKGVMVVTEVGCHLFADCPFPSGLFGCDSNVMELSAEDNRKGTYRDHLWGGEWLLFQELDELRGFIRNVVTASEDWLREKSQFLLNEPALLCGRDYFEELSYSREEASIALIEQELLKRTEGLNVSFPIRKMAGQIYWKLKGHPKWSHV